MTEYELHAPCMIKRGNRPVDFSQLDDRIKAEYMPSIILNSSFSEEEVTLVVQRLKKIPYVSFDISEHTALGLPEIIRRFESIAKLRDNIGESISSEVSCKTGSTIPQDRGSHLATFGIDNFRGAYERNLVLTRDVMERADSLGLYLTIENRPRPNYGIDPETKQWKLSPVFIGTILCSADEINRFYESLEYKPSLALDTEHLRQVVQWGNIFNFENAHNGLLRYSDLDAPQRTSLDSYGLGYEGDDVLFDYSDLSQSELDFMNYFGFIWRENNPLVYSQQLTLRDELRRLDTCIPITSVTPGFQVSQFYMDGGERKIGSHMAGIQKQYVRDPELRERMKGQTEAIHAAVFQFMRESGITDIELEPNVYDPATGKKVYSGPEWIRQYRIAREQLMENFRVAEENPESIDYNLVPYL